MDISITWNYSISMSIEAFQSVNVPVSHLSVLMDIVFVFCLVSPQQEQPQMKQPLNLLVGSLVGCNTALHVCTLLFVVSDFIYSPSNVNSIIFYDVAAEILLFTMRTSVTSSLWLNVFYYCQIVPAQLSFFIWLKKNIRLFIYAALVLDKFFFLFTFIVYVWHYIEIDLSQPKTFALSYTVIINFWSRLVYFLFSLCVMLTSSCATVLYLRRHMKNMKESSRSSPHLHSQMRVTITGIIQTLLYFLCSVWLVICDSAFELTNSYFDADRYVLCTVITLYSFGTNINLGVGQSIFRERIVLLWQKACEMVPALLH
ncbi:taste receptor type 2 member 1-like [Pygocentrus nattereri]|uniref:taste receptor type 2 member 1-like n=1 Tax=Pygocentrus nattereri TaxID=42514 RepID=UPI0018913BA9|nr:taste receptor type 2 member 1-like [Pygocentrus nattereri]